MCTRPQGGGDVGESRVSRKKRDGRSGTVRRSGGRSGCRRGVMNARPASSPIILRRVGSAVAAAHPGPCRLEAPHDRAERGSGGGEGGVSALSSWWWRPADQPERAALHEPSPFYITLWPHIGRGRGTEGEGTECFCAPRPSGPPSLFAGCPLCPSLPAGQPLPAACQRFAPTQTR